MTKLYGSYLRVIYQGEVHFVIGQSITMIPVGDSENEMAIVPTLLITKLEFAHRPGEKERLIEVFVEETVPMTSEIKSWLMAFTDL